MQTQNKSHSSLFLLITLSLFLLYPASDLVPAQQKTQEEVMVIAVEVPVRVLHKGQAVKDLTKEDFEIYEDGIKQEITAFEVVSRKIFHPEEIRAEELRVPPEKRLFILIFNIFDYNETVGQGIDYFFNNFFRQGDQVIILVESQILNIETGKGISGLTSSLKDNLKKYKLISTASTYKAYQDLRYEADRVLAALRHAELGRYDAWARDILKFYENYQRLRRDYNLKSLRPLVEKDFELREVAQDYENCFKDISFSTGGHTVFSNKVSEALQEAAETEDFHYLLVYSPKDNQPFNRHFLQIFVIFT